MNQENIGPKESSSGNTIISKGTFLYKLYINDVLCNVFADGEGGTYSEADYVENKPVTVYIKKISDNVVQIGGQHITEYLIEDGWEPYYGTIPDRTLSEFEYFVLEDNVLTIKTDEKRKKEDLANKMKEYLNQTDFKMTVDYFQTLTESQQIELTQKRAEARQIVREYYDSIQVETIAPTITNITEVTPNDV